MTEKRIKAGPMGPAAEAQHARLMAESTASWVHHWNAHTAAMPGCEWCINTGPSMKGMVEHWAAEARGGS